MSNIKLQAARELLQEKNYEVARAILESMPDEPIAQQWLSKLNALGPKPKAIIVQPLEEPPTSGWRVEKTESPFDDSTTVVLMRHADKPVFGMVRSLLPVLVIKCHEGRLYVFIYTGGQLSNDDGIHGKAEVRIRFDKESTQSMFMDEAREGDAVFFPDPKKAIATMLQHRVLAFGFTPFGASPGHTTFDLEGLVDVLREMPRGCR